MKNSWRKWTVLSVLVVLFCSMCEKNPSESEEEPPQLPPDESMMIDLSLFGSGGSANKASQPETQLNFTAAALTLTAVNVTVGLHLSVPAMLLGAAISQEPVLQNDAKFHWVYTSQNANVSFGADLAGWIVVKEARSYWEMRVTQSQLSLSRFLWYDGWCNLDASGGQWIFYDFRTPSFQHEVIQIDWEITDDTHRTLIFKNIDNNNANLGDRLTYQADGDSMRVMYEDVSEDVTAKIIWNRETTAGYIQLPNYNSGEPARWDEQRQDIN